MERSLSASPMAQDWRAACHRTDPYWGGMWSQGALAAWVSAALARRQSRAGLDLPVPWKVEEDRARDIVVDPRRRDEVILALGALDQWRTATNEQLAALTGRRVLSSKFTTRENSSATVSALFTLGLLDWGVPVSGLYSLHRSPSGLMFYRPSGSRAYDRLVAPTLTWSEDLALTGGLPFSASHQADRHNIIAVELALRAAELCELGTAVGEKLSMTDELAYRGLGRTPRTPSAAGPDLVLVRSDGVRIAVEMTATVNTDFANKVDRWARVLEDSPWDTSGLMVLFVNVAPRDRSASRTESDIDSQLRRWVRAATKAHPGSARDRVASKMAVATWTDWFPSLGTYDDSFTLLHARRPTGASGSTWEGVDLLDVFDVATPQNTDVLSSVIKNSWCLAGTPDMLVPDDAPGPDLSDLALESLDMPRVLSDATRRSTPFGSAHGAASNVRVPPRTAWSRRRGRTVPNAV